MLTTLQYDYTKGQLPELIDVIIEEKAKLFVCAIGVPPQWAVEKLHKAGILVMNVSGCCHCTLQLTNTVTLWLDGWPPKACAQGTRGRR